MDCAVTAKRLGADRVYAVSLESMEELPADEDEKDLAFREGIRFRPNGRLTQYRGRGRRRHGRPRRGDPLAGAGPLRAAER